MREVELTVEEEGVYYFHIVGKTMGNIGDEPAVFTVK